MGIIVIRTKAVDFFQNSRLAKETGEYFLSICIGFIDLVYKSSDNAERQCLALPVQQSPNGFYNSGTCGASTT